MKIMRKKVLRLQINFILYFSKRFDLISALSIFIAWHRNEYFQLQWVQEPNLLCLDLNQISSKLLTPSTEFNHCTYPSFINLEKKYVYMITMIIVLLILFLMIPSHYHLEVVDVLATEPDDREAEAVCAPCQELVDYTRPTMADNHCCWTQSHAAMAAPDCTPLGARFCWCVAIPQARRRRSAASGRRCNEFGRVRSGSGLASPPPPR